MAEKNILYLRKTYHLLESGASKSMMVDLSERFSEERRMIRDE